ncbi:malate dehydrogenase [Alkalispirochaeta sphaeroplastigenens]|uniref:Malate dehydrogenase n=1 Tax=Alkalispirochaeta sphaeroplastigenens TaxID=1187066 RepID=A0A2S4JX55_9SPIO|nr:NADP-dependent malic enzyme [Alkalispirochaeta sphaeroplastigenens]POR04094.1 malate dehydrogenase [Alkalispirochaeta sphaeroplastigenens]
MAHSKTPGEDREAQANRWDRLAVSWHRHYLGKMETVPRCVVRGMDDFSVWYSPGVAEACQAIVREPGLVDELTSRGNTVAVVSDGSRVLGLGDIGPKAGFPVMEGKALLYKYLGGVDSVPIMLNDPDPDSIIRTVLNLQPSFGGINLEDIAQPKCFRILDTLRKEAEIPVWHDDQQGTATVTLAGLLNALDLVGKRIEDVRIAFIGAGAANVACARLIFGRGADPGLCTVSDRHGILTPDRSDLREHRQEYPEKWELAEMTNRERRTGGTPQAMEGADVVIALSQPGPGVILPEWVRTMAEKPIVFPEANPVPEIWPWEAQEAGAAVVATGRSDFPNQVNNSLCFPGIFRGALDVGASTISDGMCFAAAEAIARRAREHRDYGPQRIMPTMEEWDLFGDIAAAVGLTAQKEGITRLRRSGEELREMALTRITRSRRITEVMMEQGLIPPPPEGDS